MKATPAVEIPCPSRRAFSTSLGVGTLGFLLGLTRGTAAENGTGNRPNILWITTEDNNPLFGCYGDPSAKTPHMDALAAQGVIYTNVFCNSPVCAPARIALFTGRYAASMGTQNMRSWYPIPETVSNYANIFRKAGYYCTNSEKTDYNCDGDDRVHWDESSKTAHYRNRKPGQPFFHVYSNADSHEWNIWNVNNERVRADPAKMVVPPFLPDTPLIRMQLARGYDIVENADRAVGGWIKELGTEGVADNTIVFIYGDNGGVAPRSKRYLYERGTHVPLIVYFPEKYRHLSPAKPGGKVDRLISFVDFAPTAMSLCGIDVPSEMVGTPFLGPKTGPEPEDVFLFRGRMDERVDLSRALRSRQYLYIRNYMPHRPNGLPSTFMFKQLSYGEWQRLFQEGKCNPAQSAFWQPKPAEELYDVQADPWEVNNLASHPRHQDVLQRMRQRLSQRVRQISDAGFCSEIRSEALLDTKPLRTAVDDGDIPLERIIETAEIASWADLKNLPELVKRLDDADPSVGYWAATGLVALEKSAAPARDALMKASNHPAWEVRIPAAESLCAIGERKQGLSILLEGLKEKARISLYAANALDAVDTSDPLPDEMIPVLKEAALLEKGQPRKNPKGYARFYLGKDLLNLIVARHVAASTKALNSNKP